MKALPIIFILALVASCTAIDPDDAMTRPRTPHDSDSVENAGYSIGPSITIENDGAWNDTIDV